MQSDNGKNKTQQTVVAFVLDESYSMLKVAHDTVDGFNDYMDALKKDPSQTILHLMTFNSVNVGVPYNFEDISEVSDLDILDYRPDGNTPLLDAVGTTIKETEKFLEVSNLDDPQVLVTIMTDGWENDSRAYTHESITQMISEKESMGWEFTYLGAAVSSWSEANRLGIKRRNFSRFEARDPKAAFRRSAGQAINFKQQRRNASR